MNIKPQPLDKKDNDLCLSLGIFGTILSLVVLFQHFILMISFWITYLMALIYFISVLSFVLLTLKKRMSPIMLSISSIFLFLVAAFQIVTHTYSLVVILLVLYTLVATTLIFMNEMPRKFKSNYTFFKNESDYWSNKL